MEGAARKATWVNVLCLLSVGAILGRKTGWKQYGSMYLLVYLSILLIDKRNDLTEIGHMCSNMLTYRTVKNKS